MRIAGKIAFLVSVIVLAHCGPADEAAKTVNWLDTPPDLSALLPPSNLKATCNGPAAIRLTWNATDTSATHFSIERKSESEDFAVMGEVKSNLELFDDETARLDVQYTYRVQAVIQDVDGNISYVSEYTDEVHGLADAQCQIIEHDSSTLTD